MTDGFSVISERIDDVPLIIEIAKQLKLDDLIEEHLGTHGLQQGIDNGKLAMGWLAYIISQADHRLNSVRDWANKMPLVLGSLLGNPVRSVEFSDDRLGNLLDRLAEDASWEALEAKLWKNAVEVYEFSVNTVRFDGTAACGYHDITENGLMQYGASKDHRPDLPQLKIMAASVDPGLIIGMDIASGEQNDDVMYVPLIQRAHAMMDSKGALYVGDCKMGALNIRSTIQSNGDYYLMPLGMMTEKFRTYFNGLVDAIVDGVQPAELIYNLNGECIVAGYETSRTQENIFNNNKIHWIERIFVYRSKAFAENEIRKFEREIEKTEEALYKLTPLPQRGRRQIYDEETLQNAINSILEKNSAQGLLEVIYEKQIHGGKERYVILKVVRNAAKIDQIRNKCGWRPMATNAPLEFLSFSQAILTYRGEWRLENSFKLLKKNHLGITPMYVRKDDRLKGLSRLLSIALRLVALIQYRIREGLAASKEMIEGLEKGKPNSKTSQPTTLGILNKFVREQITLSGIVLDGKNHYHMTPLNNEIQKILRLLKIPLSVYEASRYVPV